MRDAKDAKYTRCEMRKMQNIQDARCERCEMRDVRDVLDVKTCYKRQIGRPFVLLGLMRQAVRSNHRLSIANRTFAV